MLKLKALTAIFIFAASISACTENRAKPDQYVWQNLTEAAAFPPGYNYPVFVMNGEMRALYDGGWISKDGRNWTKTNLPEAGLNSAYQKYVHFKESVYALGAMEGNYLNMRLSTKIARTRDFRTWETLAEKSNLPERVFYGAVVFKDKIWLAGGWDGARYYNDVWNSADGVNWTRVAESASWSPRNARLLVVFKDRIWLIGGGVIDGDKTNNPNAGKEVWSSADGINWNEVKVNSSRPVGGAPVVFDDKLWLIGGNRNDGQFDSALFVSGDGISWQSQAAPWSPRGAVAAWVLGDKLFMTGGKYSYAAADGKIKFVYRNDVWAMSKKTE